jgi:sugar phosphate isomerase/epimerase
MKIGCCTTIDNYEALCKIGYDYIELSAYDIYNMTEKEFEIALAKVIDLGVPCLGFNAYCKSNLSMVGPEFNLNKIRDYSNVVCKRGSKLGIKYIGIGAPFARILPDGWEKEIADKQMEQFLKVTSEIAQSYKQIVLLEALNAEICNYITSTDEAYKMVKKLNLPNLKLVLDFYHMEMMNEELESVNYVIPYVKHLHISHRGPGIKRDYLNENDYYDVFRIINFVRTQGYDSTISIEADHVLNFYDAAKLNYKILKMACSTNQD